MAREWLNDGTPVLSCQRQSVFMSVRCEIVEVSHLEDRVGALCGKPARLSGVTIAALACARLTASRAIFAIRFSVQSAHLSISKRYTPNRQAR